MQFDPEVNRVIKALSNPILLGGEALLIASGLTVTLVVSAHEAIVDKAHQLKEKLTPRDPEDAEVPLAKLIPVEVVPIV